MFLVSGIGHILALILFLYNIEEVDEEGYFYQFIIALCFSLFLSIYLLFVQKSHTIIILFLCKMLVYIVITYPVESILPTKMLIGSAILIEISQKLDCPKNLFMSIAFLVLANLFQFIFTVLDSTTGLMGLDTFLFLNGIFSFIIVITTYLKYTHEKNEDLQNRLHQLAGAVQQLSEANIKFQQQTIDVAEKTMINERNRISREIHDSSTYALTNLKMMIEASIYLLKSNSNLPKLRNTLENGYAQALEGLKNIRIALRDMRSINRSKLYGLQAVERMVRSFESATEVKVKTEYTNVPMSLGDSIDSFIYRFIQEGMANALRHGKASVIHIIFGLHNDTLMIKVRDNGEGSKSIEDGIGFSGMKERVKKLDGVFTAANVIDGFEIKAEIPYQKAGEKAG
jgi:signal transduction histidine kinase